MFAADRKEATRTESFGGLKGFSLSCLCSGHRSKDCKRHFTCKVCDQNHLSVLHITKTSTASTDIKQSKKTLRVTPSSSETRGHTGTGKDDYIVPDRWSPPKETLQKYCTHPTVLGWVVKGRKREPQCSIANSTCWRQRNSWMRCWVVFKNRDCCFYGETKELWVASSQSVA